MLHIEKLLGVKVNMGFTLPNQKRTRTKNLNSKMSQSSKPKSLISKFNNLRNLSTTLKN